MAELTDFVAPDADRAPDGKDPAATAPIRPVFAASGDGASVFAADEATRVAALGRLGILDTPPEASYDDLTSLAAGICSTATALLTFIDVERQWIKARVGFDGPQIDRKLSVCGHAIRDAFDLAVIEDLASDQRFAAHPFVVGAPNFRFYAGAPITREDGVTLGSVCVFDTKPRVLDAGQRRALESLARQAASLLDLRAHTHAAAESKTFFDAIRRDSERLELALAGGDVGLWDWQVQTGAVVRNAQWSALFGYTPEETAAAHDGMWRQLVDADDAERSRLVMERHFAGETPRFECEVRMRHRDGHWMWVLDRAKVVERDASGRPIRVVGVTINVTERKAGELALRRTSDVLERVGRLARVGGWEIDARSRALVWSDEAYRIHEVARGTPADLDGAIRFYPLQVRQTLREVVEAGLRDGTPFDLELPMTTAKGNDRWVRAMGVGEMRDGKTVRLFGALQDITERKRTERALVDSERRLRLVADNLPAQIAHVDANERFTFVNAGTAAALGVDAAVLVGRPFREGLSDEAYARIAPHVAAALAGDGVTFEDHDDRPGHAHHFRTQYLPDRDVDGSVRGFYAMTLDLSDQQRVERRISETEERLRGITDNLPAMIAEIDAEGRFLFCNETYRQWLGVDPQNVLGMRVDEAIRHEYSAARGEHLRAAYRGEKVVFEEEVRLPAGLRWLQTTYVPHVDARGVVTGVYALTHDITEMKDVERRLDALARVDPLTGLANRRAFEERIGDAIARTRRAGGSMALMYLDIDRFKAINDTLGHGAGDAVLVEFARRMHATVRATDIVARYAGDEFVVALEGIADEAEARDVATKLVAAMRQPFHVEGQSLAVTTSLGIALCDGETANVTTLLSAADRALYEAKSGGRDRVSVAGS